MTQNDTLTNPSLTTTATPNLDALVCHAPATDDLLELADWLAGHGTAHLSAIARIELAERLITRRRFIIGAGALGLSVITGCGSQEAAAPTATNASTGYPRTVEHAGGSTIIETKPTRVYAARTSYELDTLLALGVVPELYGTVLGRTLGSWQMGVADAKMVDVSGGGPNIEAILAARVDLVIISELFANAFPEEIEAYQQIAPVVIVPIGLGFTEQLRIVAECLDISSVDVQNTLTEIEAVYDDFTVAELPASIALIASSGTNVFFLTPTSPTAALLERLGLPEPTFPDAVEVQGVTAVASEEVLGDINADVILGLTTNELAGSLEELEANPLFQAIPAVQAGRYQRLDNETSAALGSPTVLSTPVAVMGLQRTFDALA